MNKKKLFITSLCLVLFTYLVLMILWQGSQIKKHLHANSVNNQGIALVHQLNKKPVQEVTDLLQVRLSPTNQLEDGVDIQTLKNQWKEELLNNTVSAVSSDELAQWNNLFQDKVIFGDSMAQAIGDYGLIDSSRVVYERSAYIEKLTKDKSQVVHDMHPNTLVMFTGLNDCSYYEGKVSTYITDYKQMISIIKQDNPHLKVIVCSVLPPNEGLKATRLDLAASPDFDKALQELCQEEKWTYLDTKWLVSENLYLDDGIHYNVALNTVLLRYLVTIL